MSGFFSFALGIATKNNNGEILEVYYPNPQHHPDPETTQNLGKQVGYQGGNQVLELNSDDLSQYTLNLSPINQEIFQKVKDQKSTLIVIFLESDETPKSVAEVYLKLHLLSHRLVKPHQTNLTGMFGILPNLAWTNEGTIELEELPQRQLEARLKGNPISVNSVDKFPKMTDYVVPKGVRISVTARVRLGAYLGEGTTVMHEGFVNFNAGTAGPNMIEGRISAGVFVESGSDLGGGCSTMGTLSGGNDVVISVGKDCLIGANAGLGIPLGDRCTIEAGLYLTGSSKVSVLDDKKNLVEVTKASALANKADLLFRRNSQSGTIECLTSKSAIVLNHELHDHN